MSHFRSSRTAIKVYQAAGFTIVRTYAQATNGSIFDFVEMELLPG